MGKVIFMATHDIFNAVELGTTIGIMKEGALVKQVNANEINAGQLNKLYLETI
jgi:ABC-2 type transport system ATP-binding protein